MKQFPKLMIVDDIVEWFETEGELDAYVWDTECNQVEGYDFDEAEEEWSDFVARHADVSVEEYDETDHDHKMLSGAEDKRPGILEYQRIAKRQKAIERVEYSISRLTSVNKELEALLDGE